MRTFILVYFIVGALGAFCRALFLAWGDYPRQVKYSRAEDLFLVLLGIGFLVWAAWLLWS